MATDERILNRRKLVKRLSVKLDEAEPEQISNNDVRRLLEQLPQVIRLVRCLDKYPKGFPVPDPNDVILYDHCTTQVLDHYAVRGERLRLPHPLLQETEAHLRTCSACAARLAMLESRLVLGERVRPGNPNEPRRVAIDDVTRVGSGPTTLSPTIGIAAGSSSEND